MRHREAVSNTGLLYQAKDKLFMLDIFYCVATKRYTFNLLTSIKVGEGTHCSKLYVTSGHASWTNSVACAKKAMAVIAIMVGCDMADIKCIR